MHQRKHYISIQILIRCCILFAAHQVTNKIVTYQTVTSYSKDLKYQYIKDTSIILLTYGYHYPTHSTQISYFLTVTIQYYQIKIRLSSHLNVSARLLIGASNIYPLATSVATNFKQFRRNSWKWYKKVPHVKGMRGANIHAGLAFWQELHSYGRCYQKKKELRFGVFAIESTLEASNCDALTSEFLTREEVTCIISRSHIKWYAHP